MNTLTPAHDDVAEAYKAFQEESAALAYAVSAADEADALDGSNPLILGRLAIWRKARERWLSLIPATPELVNA